MKTLPLTGLAAALLLTTTLTVHAADTAEGKWLVRGRVVQVNPANDGGITNTRIGGKPKGDNDTVPEVDLTYFVTPNIGVEVIAATTKHDTKVARTGGNIDLGSVRLLPPTATVQYHFTNEQLGQFKPYVGAGITYAHFYDADHPGFNSVKYDDSFGVALQAGVDYKLTDNIYLNADIKKIYVSTDVSVNNGTVTAKAELNPVVAGLGIGYRF